MVILPLGRLRQEDCLGLQAVPGYVLSFMLDRATDTEKNVMREEANVMRGFGEGAGEKRTVREAAKDGPARAGTRLAIENGGIGGRGWDGEEALSATCGVERCAQSQVSN